MRLNGRVKAIEEQLKPPTPLAALHLAADDSLALYANGRLLKDMGILFNLISHTNLPPAPETPGPAGPETFRQKLDRVYNARTCDRKKGSNQ